MPASLLKHAVMAALAGTGGRKLSGTGGTADPCTTNLCGEPLGADPAPTCPPGDICGDHTPAVAGSSDSGSASPTIPAVLLSADDYVNEPHELLGPEGSYNASSRALYMRANNIPGLHENDIETKVYAQGGDIKVVVHATDTAYDHAQYGCQLFAQAHLNTTASSKTFQAGTDHGEFKTTAFDDGQFDTNSNTFEVTVPDFAAAQSRVGDLVADLTIWMTCKDPLDDLISDSIYLYTEDVDDTKVEGVDGVEGETGVRAQIRRQMIASGVSDDDAWKEQSALDFTVTPQWSARSHAKLPLDVQGTSTLVLKKDIIYPVGKWGDFVQDHNYQGKIECTNAIQPTSMFGDFINPNVQVPFADFEFGVEETCNDAGVCWGRQQVSQIQWNSTTGANLPYEVPLPKYYDAQPEIVCKDPFISDVVTQKTVAVTLDANAADAETNNHWIGNEATNSDVLGNLNVTQASAFPFYTDFGAAWIGNDTAKDLSAFFDVTQVSASTTSNKWFDLDAEYDYRFQVIPKCTTITTQGIPKKDTDGAKSIVCAEPQQDGVNENMLSVSRYPPTAKVWQLGANISAVQSSLATLLADVQGVDITMPQKYGETRDRYEMTVSSGQTQVTADLRHTNSEVNGTNAFALDFEASDTGALSKDLFGWERSDGEVLFDPDQLTWVRTDESPDVTLAKDQGANRRVCDATGAGTPSQYRFYTEDETGDDCGSLGAVELFWTASEVFPLTPPLFGNVDRTNKSEYVWYTSSLGAESSDNLVLCNEASITFHSQIKKRAQDSREDPGPVEVSRTYIDAQYNLTEWLRLDLRAGGPNYGYVLSVNDVGTQKAVAGDTAVGSINGQTFTSRDNQMGSVTDKTITVIAADRYRELEYHCGGSGQINDPQLRSYENNYTMPCGDEPARVLVENVPYEVLYNVDQVTYTVPDSIKEASVDEWDLQHNQGTQYTFDLTLDADHGLRWSGGEIVLVTVHVPKTATNTDGFALEGGVHCIGPEGEDGLFDTLTCVVSGQEVVDALKYYDTDNTLADNSTCGGANLACPWFTVVVEKELRQPALGITGQWSGNPAPINNPDGSYAPPTNPDSCKPDAIRHYLPSLRAGTRRVVVSHDITINVVGSEQIYRGAVGVFKDKDDTAANRPFRYADAESKDQATGERGEYWTPLIQGTDSSSGSLVGEPEAAPGMRFAILFQADSDAEHTYEVTSESLGVCAQQTWSEDCVSTGPMSSPVNITVQAGSSMVLFVRLHGDANPCADSFASRPAKFGAYGEDLSFTISRADTTPKLRHMYTLPLTCDTHAKESTLRIKKKDEEDAEPGEILFPDVVLGDLLQFNDFKLSRRDAAAQAIPVSIGSVTAFPSDSDDDVTFAGGDADGNIVIDDQEGTDVTFQVHPGDDATISCSYLLVELQAPVDADFSESSVTFRVQCPRMTNAASQVADALKLDYSITSMTFGLEESSIQLPGDDDSASSVVAFAAPYAECDAVFDGDGPVEADCDLSGAKGAEKPFAMGASAFMTRLDGTCGAVGGFADGVSEDGSTITLRGDVVRKYTKNEVAFGGAARTFCGRTPYTLSVDRQQDKSTLISVAHPQDMDYAVEVFTLEHQKCGVDEDNNQEYQLYVEIEAKRTGVDVSDWSADLEILGVSPAIGDQLAVNGNNITYYGECQSEAQTSQTFSFSMTTSIHGLDYTGMASVAVELQAPDVETVDELAFSAEDIVITCTRADGESAAFGAACVDGVAAADNVQLVIGVTTEEAAAFGHLYSVPTVGGDPADDLGFEYRALIGPKELATAIVSGDNKQVQLRALPFAGQGEITVLWTVTRVEGARRRLRQVVSYTLGADGSVSKSISFAVAPAVRESDGAAAVGDEIVERIEETTDDNGTTRTTTVVEERKAKPAPTQVEGSVHTTSTRTDEDKDEHAWIMVTGIVGITSMVVVFAVVIYLCYTRRSTGGASGASQGKQVVGSGFMGAPMRWQRDRFLNNI